MGVVASTLLLELGGKVLKEVIPRLLRRPNSEEKFKKAEALISTGSSAVAALRQVFGVEFDEVLTEAVGKKANGWTYEAGCSEYIRVRYEDGGSKDVCSVLRDELNINLARLAKMSVRDGGDLTNYFKGLFSQWEGRYRELTRETLAYDEFEVIQTFQAINSMIDGEKRSFLDVLRMLQRAGLGLFGALLILQAGLIVSGTGIGIVAIVSTWLFGIPFIQVLSLVIGGGLLFVMSRANFSSTNAMSTSVAMAYKLLDRTAARMSAGRGIS